MKLTIYMTADGCERLAKDPSTKPYAWEFGVRIHGDDIEYPQEMPKSCLTVAELVVDIPADVDYLSHAVRCLNETLTQKMAEAHKAEVELRSRISNLLAIGHESRPS